MVVGSRDTGESCNASRSHGVAGEDVGGEATAVAFAGSVDLVRVDTILVRDRVDHVDGEANVVSLGRRVALPLLVDTLRVCDQHVLVRGRLRELGERFLVGGSLRTTVEREDQAVRLVLIIVSREVQEESPLCAIGSGEVDLVALSSTALLEL